MLSECPNRDGGMETPPFLKLKPRLMDTKKKAIRLYRKYSHILDGDYLVTHSQIIEMCILCVDEILGVIVSLTDFSKWKDWNEVKEHLNNM